jgi:membrane fusion protein (multidrug efflux system)
MNGLLLRRVLVAAVFSLLIMVAGFWMMDHLGSRPATVRQMSFKESSKAVQVSQVEYRSREISLSTLGRVVSANAVDVIAEVQGQILPGEVPLKTGRSFRKGQVLFQVNDEEARFTLFAQKSDFLTLIAGVLPEVMLDYPDSYPVWQAYFDQLAVEKPLPPLPEIANSQQKVFFSTKGIFSQYYSLKSAEERLTRYTVKAPFSGSFLEVLQEVNTVTNPGNRVARIARSGSLELEAPISRGDLEFVKAGVEVKVMAESGGKGWRGRINRIASSMDPNTQSVNAYITFSAPGQQVFDGQYLRIEIPGTRIRDVMEIPRKAIINQNQVYVVNDSSRLEIATVQIEKVTQESLFFSGLPSGQQVVNEALFNAYENMPVTVRSPQSPELTTP